MLRGTIADNERNNLRDLMRLETSATEYNSALTGTALPPEQPRSSVHQPAWGIPHASASTRTMAAHARNMEEKHRARGCCVNVCLMRFRSTSIVCIFPSMRFNKHLCMCVSNNRRLWSKWYAQNKTSTKTPCLTLQLMTSFEIPPPFHPHRFFSSRDSRTISLMNNS